MKVVHFCAELEAEYLGHLMHIGTHDDLAVQKAILLITPKTFYKPINAKLYAMIKGAFQKQQPFDFVEMMVKLGHGNQELYEHLNFICEGYQAINVTGKLEYQLEKLLNLERARHNFKLAEEGLAEGYEATDPVEANTILRDKAKQICELDTGEMARGFTQQELLDDILSGKTQKARIIPTRSGQFNYLLGGFEGGVRSKSLITIAGAAGVGKTGFAVWLLDIIAKNQPDRHSIFFSLEMEPPEILMRHIGIMAEKQFDKIPQPEFMDAAAWAMNAPMTIFDYRFSDIDQIITTSRLMATEKAISVIVVDYLTLVVNRGNFERNDLRQADTTTKLARLALELDCIVIALSQVNRGVTGNAEDQCPQPHHAADSSGSHRSSTLWLGIDRPELYNDDPCYKDQFVIKCRKNRYGANFEHHLKFNSGTFLEVDPGYFKKPTKKTSEDIFEKPYKEFHK